MTVLDPQAIQRTCEQLTCGSSLTLPLTAGQVNQVQFAHADVAGFGSSSCVQTAGDSTCTKGAHGSALAKLEGACQLTYCVSAEQQLCDGRIIQATTIKHSVQPRP
jgi:hypothetical protein